MSLLIENRQNIFYVKGEIDQYNSEVFKRYILVQLISYPNLTIDISKVSKIDNCGMDAFTALYLNALKRGKDFNVIGYKGIYDDLSLSA